MKDVNELVCTARHAGCCANYPGDCRAGTQLLARHRARRALCRRLGGDIDVAVAGLVGGPSPTAASHLAGVTRVRHSIRPRTRTPRRRAGAQLAHWPATTRTACRIDHVSARTCCRASPALLDVPPQRRDAVETPTRFRRPIYAGNALLTVEAGALKPIAATVRIASFDVAESNAGPAPIEATSVVAPGIAHTRFVSLSTQANDRPDLQSARRVVSGGRALGSAEKFALVQQLADALGAAVGASRAAVDAGYAANDLQGARPARSRPELYVALGISGAIQHMTGIKDARVIVRSTRMPTPDLRGRRLWARR